MTLPTVICVGVTPTSEAVFPEVLAVVAAPAAPLDDDPAAFVELLEQAAAISITAKATTESRRVLRMDLTPLAPLVLSTRRPRPAYHCEPCFHPVKGCAGNNAYDRKPHPLASTE
jgi:hypothetical protein